MKTIKFSMLALLFISLISCSGDEAVPNTDESLLTGDWNLEKLEYQGTSETNVEGTEFEGMDFSVDFIGVSKNPEVVLSLNENKTYTAQGGYIIELSILSSNMDDLNLEVPLEDFISNGNWSMDGNKMMFSEGFLKLSTGEQMASEPGEARIEEATANRMVLSFDYETTTTEQGYEVKVTMNGNYILTR